VGLLAIVHQDIGLDQISTDMLTDPSLGWDGDKDLYLIRCRSEPMDGTKEKQEEEEKLEMIFFHKSSLFSRSG